MVSVLLQSFRSLGKYMSVRIRYAAEALIIHWQVIVNPAATMYRNWSTAPTRSSSPKSQVTGFLDRSAINVFASLLAHKTSFLVR